MSNLTKRILSSIVFGAVMVFGVIWDRTVFGGLFLLIMIVCLQEFYGISLGGRFAAQQKMAIVAAAVAFLTVAGHFFYGWSPVWTVLALIPLLIIPFTCIFLANWEDFDRISLIYAGLLYIALPFVLSPMVMMDGDVFDGWTMLCFFAIEWFSDIGAYTFGNLFGQKENSRKLAPEISPRKSWWGFWGGISFGVILAVVLHFVGWLRFPLVHSVILGVIITVAGVVGDLFESMWKRHFHVKDSGNCIPGHGGMLDRFDSILVALPLAYIYTILIKIL